MTWGVLRPVILLPADAAGWPEERLTMALLHELAHVKRWDCLTQLIARAACAVYWFNPLSWLALARVRSEQEQASDDLALGCGLDRHAYADHCWRSSPVEPPADPARPWRSRWRQPRSWSAGCSASSTRAGAGARRPADHRSRHAGMSALLLPLAALRPLVGAELLPAQAVAAPAESPRGDGQPKPDAADAVESEVLAKVRAVFVKPPDESALRQGAIKGILDALHDPYSSYFSAEQLAEMDSHLQGKVTGIGAQLELKDGNVTIVTPLPDSPAIKAGLRPGDVIEAVDDQPTRGLELPAVVKRILGKAGEVVRLKVKHADGRAEDLAVTRGIVTIRSVRGFRPGDEGRDSFLDPDHAIGYARVSQFGTDTAAELRTTIGRLSGRG